jgi:heat shock protein HslJ
MNTILFYISNGTYPSFPQFGGASAGGVSGCNNMAADVVGAGENLLHEGVGMTFFPKIF